MHGLVTSDYKCNSCNHEWMDSKQRGYETASFEYSGCPNCKSKDCSWEHHVYEDSGVRTVALHGTSNNLGKPPKEFVDGVLGRIKQHHSGYKGNKSSINTDWY